MNLRMSFERAVPFMCRHLRGESRHDSLDSKTTFKEMELRERRWCYFSDREKSEALPHQSTALGFERERKFLHASNECLNDLVLSSANDTEFVIMIEKVQKLITEKKLDIDLNDNFEQWWTDGGDNKKLVNRRLDEFMALVKYGHDNTLPVSADTNSNANVVVVGHSHFFRDVFRKFVNLDVI